MRLIGRVADKDGQGRCPQNRESAKKRLREAGRKESQCGSPLVQVDAKNAFHAIVLRSRPQKDAWHCNAFPAEREKTAGRERLFAGGNPKDSRARRKPFVHKDEWNCRACAKKSEREKRSRKFSGVGLRHEPIAEKEKKKEEEDAQRPKNARGQEQAERVETESTHAAMKTNAVLLEAQKVPAGIGYDVGSAVQGRAARGSRGFGELASGRSAAICFRRLKTDMRARIEEKTFERTRGVLGDFPCREGNRTNGKAKPVRWNILGFGGDANTDSPAASVGFDDNLKKGVFNAARPRSEKMAARKFDCIPAKRDANCFQFDVLANASDNLRDKNQPDEPEPPDDECDVGMLCSQKRAKRFDGGRPRKQNQAKKNDFDVMEAKRKQKFDRPRSDDDSVRAAQAAHARAPL